jgi:hypothetical protein
MRCGLTVYDCATLFRAHPKAIRALLAGACECCLSKGGWWQKSVCEPWSCRSM